MNKLNEVSSVSMLGNSDSILAVAGNKVSRISVADIRSTLVNDDNVVLSEFGFYMDINTPSAKGAQYVDHGGNEHIRSVWEGEHKGVLMDKNGNYTPLNPSDFRYLTNGEPIIDMEAGTILDKWKNCDVMVIGPKTYGCIQTVTEGSTTKERLWLSLVPLPKGFTIPQMVVGKFPASLVDGVLRSLPGMVTADSKNINQFWDAAQKRSKSHGLTDNNYRMRLLFHMMSKYGWRDSQNCKTADGTLVWGVGLDGTESKGTDKFACQKNIKTGCTLSLGNADGKVAVADSDGNIVHDVNVLCSERPWGQKWEMGQGLCSVGDVVYAWNSNVMPTGTPTAATFANIDHVELTRMATESNTFKLSIIASDKGQGVYLVPTAVDAGLNWGDHYYYNKNGQLWLFGGSSNSGSYLGLACSHSYAVWSYSYANVSARLAYYGNIEEVSPTRLAELAA